MDMMQQGNVRFERLAGVVALATGLLAFALCAICGIPSVNPSCWSDLAAAAGLRPSPDCLNGLVRGLYACLFAWFPSETSLTAVRVAGWLGFGLAAYAACRSLFESSRLWISIFSETRRGRLVCGAIGLSVTVTFVCTDAVWFSFQGLTADGLQILMMLGAMLNLQAFVHRHRRRDAVFSMLLWSVLAADCPFALIGVCAVPVTVFFVNRVAAAIKDEKDPLANPLVRMSLRRFLAVAFFFPFVLTVLAECSVLRSLRGFVEMPDLVFSATSLFPYIKAVALLVVKSVSWQMALLVVEMVIVPVLTVTLLRDRALESDDFLPVRWIAALSVAAGVAWSQLCGSRGLDFTTWFGGLALTNASLHAALLFILAHALFWVLIILGVLAFLRPPREVAELFYAEAAECAAGGKVLTMLDKFRRVFIVLGVMVPVAMVLWIVPHRGNATLDGMMNVVEDTFALTLDECKGLTRVFTDGKTDSGLELAAWRRGQRLYAVSLLADNDAETVALCTRGMDLEEDREAARHGALPLLRTWVNDTPERLSGSAVQLATELWRGKRETPRSLGTVSVLPGAPALCQEASLVSRARDLGERIVALYASGLPDAVGTPLMQEVFRDVQWRLSRLAGLRAEQAGEKGWGPEAEAEQRLADRLRELNSACRELDKRQDRLGESGGLVLTPREGLRFALDHANFRLAAAYAAVELKSNPAHPEANFACGMDHFLSRNYARAEPYLRRCLEMRPHDPAVLNNLAVVMLRLYRYDEAARYAAEAAALLPDSIQIKRTVEAIRKARSEKKEDPK